MSKPGKRLEDVKKQLMEDEEFKEEYENLQKDYLRTQKQQDENKSVDEIFKEAEDNWEE